MKKQLKKLGIGERLLIDILKLSQDNKDLNGLVNNVVPCSVSVYLINKSILPSELYAVFNKHKLYNIHYVNLEVGKHIFKAVTSKAEIKHFEVYKKDCKSIKDACSKALLSFLDS